MRRALAMLTLLGAGMASAQITPASPPGMGPAGPGPSKAAGSSQTARKPAAAAPAIPSTKDLKFPAPRPVAMPAFVLVTLSNGMRLYLVEDHEVPLIHGLAMVRTGNLFDPPDKVGVAAITGQVMRTGGANSRTGDQINEQLDNVGGAVDSAIGESNGTLVFEALKAHTDEVLAVFKDVMTAPEFRQDKIDLAKQQLRAGIARRNDDPLGIVQREFTNTAYGKDTPYGWRQEYAHIDRINRADLQSFHRRYYFPKNIMLAVWGDFDSAGMQARIEKLFADWTAEQPPVPDFPQVNAAPAPGTFLVQKSDAQQTLFAMGLLGGEIKDKDFAALEIMAEILGGGSRGRLFQAIGKKGDTSGISARWAANFDHPGLFQISGALRPFATVSALKAVNAEVSRIRAAEVADEELKAAQDRLLNRLAFSLDTKQKMVQQLLLEAYFGYPKDFVEQYRQALAKVTRADVLRVAKERLDPARMTLVAVGNPVTFQEPLDALGTPPVPIDLTITPPRPAAAPADASGQQRAKDILVRAQEAAGGAGKLAAVKDYTREATYQLEAAAGGMLVTETVRWLAPNHFRQDSKAPAGEIAAYIDGRSGWIRTRQGSNALTGAPLKQIQGDLFRVYFALLLSDRIPGRKVNALDDLTVEVSDDGGQVVRLEFDPETWLLRFALHDTVTATGVVSVMDSYMDYRDVGGLKVPFKLTITSGGAKYADVTVKDYVLNSGLKLQDLERRP